jgi:hypothetical protein
MSQKTAPEIVEAVKQCVLAAGIAGISRHDIMAVVGVTDAQSRRACRMLRDKGFIELSCRRAQSAKWGPIGIAAAFAADSLARYKAKCYVYQKQLRQRRKAGLLKTPSVEARKPLIVKNVKEPTRKDRLDAEWRLGRVASIFALGERMEAA